MYHEPAAELSLPVLPIVTTDDRAVQVVDLGAVGGDRNELISEER